MVMIKLSRIALGAFFTCLIILNPPRARLASQQSAQQSTQSQNQSQKDQSQSNQETVVRITTQLVQIDAIITDKKGQHIEDLSEDDFELTVDGKPQQLTHFKLVRLVEPKRSGPSESKGKTPALTSMPTRRIEVEKVRRTIALVVDDLKLSFSSVAFAKDALKRFVAEQMEEGDLVGIICTGKGVGIYQQFTSDKRILYAAIDKLRFNLDNVLFTLSSADSLMGRNEPFKTPAEEAEDRRRNPQKTAREDAEKALEAGQANGQAERETAV